MQIKRFSQRIFVRKEVIAPKAVEAVKSTVKVEIKKHRTPVMHPTKVSHHRLAAIIAG